MRNQSGKEYPFEYFFDKATKERLAQNEDQEIESSGESSGEDSDELTEELEASDEKVNIKCQSATDCQEGNEPDKSPNDPNH